MSAPRYLLSVTVLFWIISCVIGTLSFGTVPHIRKVNIAGNYLGLHQNLTYNKQAKCRVLILQDGNEISGEVLVNSPLIGGKISGTIIGHSIKFRLYSSEYDIEVFYEGVVESDKIKGTYRFYGKNNSPPQSGLWEWLRVD